MRLLYFTAFLVAAPLLPTRASAQVPLAQNASQDDEFAWKDRIWLSGQANFIRQDQPSFPAKYTGTNSLQAFTEHATSRVLTLYTGFRITRSLDFLFDVEETGGDGLSHALGVAGFPNVDVVRNPTLGQEPYVSRVMLHYTLGLSDEMVEATKNPLSLSSRVPARRLEFRFGKMSTVDFFDNNAIGSDSHLQFMNWAAVNNGAYDYAADTRGYTYGFVTEWYNRFGVLRFGEMLMPKIANGLHLDANVTRARAENIEYELHPEIFQKHATVLRPLVFVNHANMGSYRDAIHAYLAGADPVPDITLYRKQGRIKYGFGMNVEQELTGIWRAFGRLGWNEGKNESFAYTEIDRTAAIGTDVAGKPWHRADDKAGLVFIDNGLSGDHREYLALGGLGFIIGDGALRYGQERIIEGYYDAHIYKGLSMAFDVQHVENPAYNRDRGAVWVLGTRIHLEGAVPFH